MSPPAAFGDPRYGRNQFRAKRVSCAAVDRSRARARFVTVNMFETVFDQTTWDIHGSAPFSPMSCYRDAVGPMFDQAYCGAARRSCITADCWPTPWWLPLASSAGRRASIPAGGRDHWTECWTMLMAGGGVRGGQVIGASDAHGAAPKAPARIAGGSGGDDLSCDGRRSHAMGRAGRAGLFWSCSDDVAAGAAAGGRAA